MPSIDNDETSPATDAQQATSDVRGDVAELALTVLGLTNVCRNLSILASQQPGLSEEQNALLRKTFARVSDAFESTDAIIRRIVGNGR